MIRRLPNPLHLPWPLLLLCGGVLVSVIVTAWVGQQLMINKLQTTSDQYGVSLVNIAARQSVDAILDRDLISLQVILSDITQNPDVVVTTIHDVENKLLAQAGDISTRPLSNATSAPNQRSFTAAITVQDSVAGYVTVTIDQSTTAIVKRQLHWLFTLSGVLLLALTITAYYFGRNQFAVHSAATNTATDSIEDNNENHEVSVSDSDHFANTDLTDTEAELAAVDTAAETEPPTDSPAANSTALNTTHQVILTLKFHNFELLRQQLSSARFRVLESKFNASIRNALPLYSGELLHFDFNGASILFESLESKSHCALHAGCYALLLSSLSPQQELHIEFSGVIHEDPAFTIDAAAEQHQEYLSSCLAQTRVGELLLAQTLAADPYLYRKLHFDANTVDTGTAEFALVVDMEESYRQLLEKQKQQLSRVRASGLPIYGN